MPCMLQVCVHRKYVWHCANGECNLVPRWHALFWHSRWVTGVRLTRRRDEGRSKVVICGQDFLVLDHYPKDRLQCDQKLSEELDMTTTDALRNICKHNPPSITPIYKDNKADPIYKSVFCDFIQSTCVHAVYILHKSTKVGCTP